MAKAKLKYLVRKKFQADVRTLSEEEIVKEIKRGKLAQEDEFTEPDKALWRKLASHPIFFDAFVKDLFQEEFPDKDSKGSKGSSSSHKSAPPVKKERTKVTRQGTNQDPLEKTNRIDPDKHGFTVRESDIDNLFSKSGQNRPEDNPDKTIKADKLEATEVAIREPSFQQERTLRAEPFSLPPPEVTAPPAKNSNRMRLYGGAILLVALVWLWQGGTKTISRLADTSRRYNLDTSVSKEEKTQSLLDEADGLINLDSYLFDLGAYEVLEEALAWDPGSVEVYSRMVTVGARLLQSGEKEKVNLEKVKSRIVQGRRLEPHWSAFYRGEAILGMAEKNEEIAKQSMLKAVQANPREAANYETIGELHFRLGNVKEARSALEDALKLNLKSLRAKYMLAQVSYQEGRYADAQSLGMEILKNNPLHGPTYYLLSKISLKQANASDALGFAETSIRLARFSPKELVTEIYLELAETYGNLGKKEEMQKSLWLASYYSPEPSAEIKKRTSGIAKPKVSLDLLAKQAEYPASYFEEQGQGLLLQGKYTEATLFLQAATLIDKSNAISFVRLGDAIEKSASSYQDFRRVMNLYERAIEQDPEEAIAYIKLGQLETEQYNFDRGLKLLTEAQKLVPDRAEPSIALGKHYYKRQHYTESLNYFIQAAKQNPNDAEILYYAGLLRLLLKKEGVKEAPRYFYQAYTLNPQHYEALVEWLKLKVQNYEKNYAVRFVRKLLEQDPKNPNLLWAMGEVYAASNENRRAITYYQQSLDLDNRNSKVRMSLGKSLEAVGELDKAVAEYKLASLLDRRNSDGFYRAADILYQLKAYSKAEEVVRYLLKVTPNYPGAYRYLSKIQLVKGQKDQAITSMQREVASNPENNKFVLELAEIYMMYGKLPEAIEELSKITNLPPVTKAPEFVHDKIRAFLLLARVYRAQSKLEPAESAIKMALSIDNNDPELHRELGYIYYSQQRDKEGVHEFETYLEKNPAATDSQEIKQLIQNMMIEE